MRLPLVFLLVATAVGGCQCHIDNNNLNQITDAGTPPHDAGPPPPTFPLKVGDSLIYPVLGGRTQDNCDGHSTPGDCQRNIKAQYDVKAVKFDTASNRWTITADATYQGSEGDLITAATLAPLVLENGAPFSTTSFDSPTQAPNSDFTTDAPATDQLTPNGFPFFQFDSGDAQVFETAGGTFCDRYRTLDADANCKVQAADQKQEVFYKDDQAGGAAELHHVRVEYHEMGMVCGWDEALIPFTDGIARDQSSFGPADTPDIAASFFQPSLVRDGVTYQCSCFTQLCSSGNGADKKCLTTDPDAAPGPCP